MEECEGEAWQAGVCNRQALNAALTHYESRVVGPLRYERSLYKLEADKLRAELAAIKAREADRCEKIGALLEVPARPAPEVEGERRVLADVLRRWAGVGGRAPASYEAQRIATLLESPAPRKSLGRRWVVLHPDGRFYCTSHVEASAQHDARYIGGTVIECDLVPVEGEP